MPKTIRNKYYEKLSYDKLMKAHKLSQQGKSLRKEIIEFNLKQEEYIMWLYESLKNKTYKHGGYTSFYVTEPKLRKIESSSYMDRIVHRWCVDSFLVKNFVPQVQMDFRCHTVCHTIFRHFALPKLFFVWQKCKCLFLKDFEKTKGLIF